MGLFKSRQEKELDIIIMRIDMNMSNNYKDNAQADLREYEELLYRFIEEGSLKVKVRSFYESKLDSYKDKMKGYTHKDQKPYWT